MRRFVVPIVALGLIVAGAGCDPLLGLFLVSRTNVKLTNNGTAPVTGTAFYSGDSSLSSTALMSQSTKFDFTLQPGESTSFTRSCSELKSVVVHAQLNASGSNGPQADSNVDREGTDFSCGNTVTYSFENSDLLIDFRITDSVSQ